MSSNPSNQERRVTSITHKFQWLIAGEKLGKAFWGSIGLFFILLFAWAFETEFSILHTIDFSLDRSFVGLDSFYKIKYEVARSTGEVLLTRSLFPELIVMFAISGSVFVLRVFDVLLSLAREKRKIRRIIAPIDEIARRADELSKLEFSEDKYELLENAISRIEPDDNKEILLHDSELQGIEDAMNGLISRMKENYRQQARFVNDASHELRTPIAVIEGYANMLSRWGKEDEKVLDESITAIKNESEHMKHLVEQLLFLARGDSGNTTLTRENVDMNDVMREIYEESLMIDENHPYRFTCCAEPLIISIDAGLVKQAVRILIDNSAKYTKQGDEILLSTGRTEDYRPYLQVQDTGIGMAQKDVEHMFERFYRADEARNTEGTGLGLSIAKWIVDKHGGKFSIVSRTDLGTRIRIIL